MFRSLCIFAAALALAGQASGFGMTDSSNGKEMRFNRVASFLVCSQLDETCNVDTETVAEIVAAHEDGIHIIYADSAMKAVGLVNLADPMNPVAEGFIELGGEPTSVAMVGDFALVSVNTSEDYVNTSGQLHVINMMTGDVERVMEIGGQPDAISVSPDRRFAAIAIENERDEDLGEGGLPQMPPGFLVTVRLNGAPAEWEMSRVEMTGLPGLLHPEDPEPEYVAINDKNVAVVTLQENNGLALIDLESGVVIESMSAGTVDIHHVDVHDEGIIEQSETLHAVPREPDGVTWIDSRYFATADEGDWLGGSRSFTIFDSKTGAVVYESGNDLEFLAARIGHYPDSRSGSKGSEPENCFAGKFGDEMLLFVNLERSGAVAVYNVDDPTRPVYQQVLPAGVGPEGGVSIPSRNLAVVASEVDARGDKIRSVLNIYQRSEKPAYYPTIVSANRANGSPIPFSALSGLAAGKGHTLYSVEDSYYKSSRIFEIDASSHPAVIVGEIRMMDTHGLLQAHQEKFGFAGLVNEDGTVNVDPEGIAVGSDFFLVASEGRGTVGDENRPLEYYNYLLKVDMKTGAIDDVITPPEELNGVQLRFGFEGVALEGDVAYVAFQRRWNGEDHARIGMYDMSAKSKKKAWDFVFYPLDEPKSQNGGWVGLSDITSLGNGEFFVLERDNQGGPDAAIKMVYKINLNGVASGAVVDKDLVLDLVPYLKASGGLVKEKIEGMAVTEDGTMYIVNDNDGVEDNSGEIDLIRINTY